MTIGTPGKPAPSGERQRICRCTHTAFSPKGDGVTDAPATATPMFSVSTYAQRWKIPDVVGQVGIGEGEFNPAAHNVHCDADGWVYVADRENHRVQVFDGNGWPGDSVEQRRAPAERPAGQRRAPARCGFIGEDSGPYLGSKSRLPLDLGPRISILSPTGKLLGRARVRDEARSGQASGLFMSSYGIRGGLARASIYGEVSAASWPPLLPGQLHLTICSSLLKLVKLA